MPINMQVLADELSLNRTTVYRKLNALGLTREDLEEFHKLFVFKKAAKEPLETLGVCLRQLSMVKQELHVLRQDHEALKLEFNQLKASLQQSHVSPTPKEPEVPEDYVDYLLDQYELFEVTVPDQDGLDRAQYSRVLYNDFSKYTDNIYTLEEFLNS